MDAYLVNGGCCQVVVFATGWSLVQRGPIVCGVSECGHEASIMRRSWSTRGCRAMKEEEEEKNSDYS
jgi:hypothetical protein